MSIAIYKDMYAQEFTQAIGLVSHYHTFVPGNPAAYLRPLSKQEKEFESVVLCSEYLWQTAGQLFL